LTFNFQYCAQIDVGISIDWGGMIEFFTGARKGYDFPEDQLDWSSKMDTDLYIYAKVCFSLD
jgi:hypothetical protein